MLAETKVNERIRAQKIILVSDDGENKGCINRLDALAMAQAKGVDLIQVSYPENDDPPVCKLMEYGKFKYWQSKKKKQKHESVKEIRISYRIAEHDLDVKHKKICEFLSDHHKVKYSMILKGREKYMKDEALSKFNEILKTFEGKAQWQPVTILGEQVMTVLQPK